MLELEARLGGSLDDAKEQAQRYEDWGYAGVVSTETSHDPMLALLLAADATEAIELSTGITLAFARSPMTTAYSAWDLQRYSGGRFSLGLGTQIEAHISRRFSMPWGHPVARMRDFVGALRAIWFAWQSGERLRYEGEFYRHTLMPPQFSPGTLEAPPRILIAAIGARMVQLAAQVGDGIILHEFATEKFLREVTLPIIKQELSTAGKSRQNFRISASCFVATGESEQELESAVDRVRLRIAFYATTPAYKPVLECHGWGDVHDQLKDVMGKGSSDRDTEMRDLITDEMLRTFAVVGPSDQIASMIVNRYRDLADRISLCESVWPSTDNAADGFVRAIGEEGLVTKEQSRADPIAASG